MLKSKSLSDVYSFATMFAKCKDNCVDCSAILYAMTVTDNEVKPFLEQFGVNSKNTNPKISGRRDEASLNKELAFLEDRATKLAQETGAGEVNCIHTLVALLTMKQNYACNKLDFILCGKGHTLNQLFDCIISNTQEGEKIMQWLKP